MLREFPAECIDPRGAKRERHFSELHIRKAHFRDAATVISQGLWLAEAVEFDLAGTTSRLQFTAVAAG